MVENRPRNVVSTLQARVMPIPERRHLDEGDQVAVVLAEGQADRPLRVPRGRRQLLHVLGNLVHQLLPGSTRKEDAW